MEWGEKEKSVKELEQKQPGKEEGEPRNEQCFRNQRKKAFKMKGIVLSNAGERSSKKRTNECFFFGFSQQEVIDEHHTPWKREQRQPSIYSLWFSGGNTLDQLHSFSEIPASLDGLLHITLLLGFSNFSGSLGLRDDCDSNSIATSPRLLYCFLWVFYILL